MQMLIHKVLLIFIRSIIFFWGEGTKGVLQILNVVLALIMEISLIILIAQL